MTRYHSLSRQRLKRLEGTVRNVCSELRMDEFGPANPPRSREAVRFLEGSLASRAVPRFNITWWLG